MKDTIQSGFKEATGYGLAINGDVRVDLLPLPQVTLNQTSISDSDGYSYDVGKIIVRTSIMSLISGKLSPSKVTLQDASFDYGDIKNIISKTIGDTKNASSIPALELSNIDISFSQESGETTDITGLNGRMTFSGLMGQNLFFKGGFSIDYLPYKIEATLNGFDESGSSEEVDFILSNTYFNASFKGKLSSLFSNPNIVGKIGLTFGNENPQDKVNSGNIKALAYQDDLKIHSDFSMSQKEINASNITISSNSIANASGGFNYTYGDSSEMIGNLSVEQFNLDQFLNVDTTTQEANSGLNFLDMFFRSIMNNFSMNITKSSVGGLKFNVKQITYNKEQIKDLKFDTSISDGQILLNDFSCSMPGESQFKVLGSVTHNDIRPKFVGNLEMNVAKFDDFRKWLNIDVSDEFIKKANTMSLKTEVSLIPRNIKFEKIQASLGDSLMVGKLSIKNTGERRLNTKVSIRFNTINTDDFKLSTKVDDVVTALFFYDADKTGKLLTDYTNDFRWLRVYPIDLNGEILVDNLIYKGHQIQNLQSAFRIEPNSIKLDRLIFSDPKIDMDSTINFNLTAFRPQIDVKSSIKKLDYNFATTLFPTDEELRKKLAFAVEKDKAIRESLTAASKEAYINAEDLREKKTEEKIEEEKEKASKPALDRYNAYSMSNFNGTFDISGEGIAGVAMPLSSFNLKGSLNEGVIKFDSLSANVFSGKLDATGSIVITSAVPAVSFSYALNNFDPSLLLGYYFDLHKISGYMSISGTVAGNGINSIELPRRLYGDIKVIGKKIRWQGFDLASIIKTVEYKMPYNQKLDNLKISIDNGETEFDDLKGNITFAKGVASLDNFELRNNRAAVNYLAKVDYINELINSLSKLSFIPVGYSSQINIDLSSKGKIDQQAAQSNIDEVTTFLQTQTGDYDRYVAEEQKKKEDSLIRNRRL